MDKVIWDLCGGTGAWSKPYKDAGYDVRNITLPEYDVIQVADELEEYGWLWRDNETVECDEVYGILAAPPCTMFSHARTKAKAPRDTRGGMGIVLACLKIIWEVQYSTKTGRKETPLKFWALENAGHGILNHFLGKPAFEFSPYEFGDGYKKKTALWGWFNPPERSPGDILVEKAYKSLNPETMKKFDVLASRGICPKLFEKLTRAERRSITPAGFAKAFFEANP